MEVSTLVKSGFFDIGSGSHWVIILVIALLIFGRRLPSIMRSLGGSIREFKKGVDEGARSEDDHIAFGNPPAPGQIEGSISRAALPAPHPSVPLAASPLPLPDNAALPVRAPTDRNG